MSEEKKTKTVADMIAESTTTAMATRTAAIETMIREFIAQTGAKAEDLVLVEQMGADKLSWHIEKREPQPAPDKPSAPQEVTTENFDGIKPDYLAYGGINTGIEYVSKVEAKKAETADIRANVERETKGLREENARLRGEVERLKVNLGDAEWARDKFLKDRDEARAANREQRRDGALEACGRIVVEIVREMKCAGREKDYKRHGILDQAYNVVLGIRNEYRDGKKLRECAHAQGTMLGQCLACGEKVKSQEHAPEKTGRLPELSEIVFWRKGWTTDGQWLLAARCYLDDGKITVENEGVLWCWPTPGMV